MYYLDSSGDNTVCAAVADNVADFVLDGGAINACDPEYGGVVTDEFYESCAVDCIDGCKVCSFTTEDEGVTYLPVTCETCMGEEGERGYYKHDSDGGCTICDDSNCLTCDSSADVCDTCMDGCYEDNDGCEDCMNNCAICTDGDTCDECMDDYTGDGTECWAIEEDDCGTGEYYDDDV